MEKSTLLLSVLAVPESPSPQGHGYSVSGPTGLTGYQVLGHGMGEKSSSEAMAAG
jgi:hypothetical protein